MRKKAVEYAHHWIGTPFSDKGHGFTCHGFIIEALKGCGLVRRNEDLTPDNVPILLSLRPLYRKFKDNKVARGHTGCLIFWFTDGNPTHVDIFVDNDGYVLGMSGGKEIRVCVRMNHVSYKRVPHEIVDPFKG